MPAILTIMHRRHADILANRAVMPHGEHGLELLYNPTIMCIDIILHIFAGKHVSLMLDMVDNLDLIIALRAALDGIVKDIAFEPIRIIKYYLLMFTLVIDLIREEISFVKFGVIDHDLFWEVGDHDLGGLHVSSMAIRIIGIGYVEVEVPKIILED